MSSTDTLMVQAPQDSELAGFIRSLGRDPNGICLGTLEHLIIKYISYFRLRDATNPSMIWSNVRLTNSLSSNRVFHATQLRGILCGLVTACNGSRIHRVTGSSSIFTDWMQAGNTFFISEALRAILMRDYLPVGSKSVFTLEEIKGTKQNIFFKKKTFKILHRSLKFSNFFSLYFGIPHASVSGFNISQ